MNPLRRFRSQCKGSVATVFAVALLPILMGSGVAVDYTRAASRRTALQNALDGAVLTASRMSGNQSIDQLKQLIKSHISSSEFGPLDIDAISLTRNGQTLAADVSTEVDTALMKVVGINKIQIAVSTRASWGNAEVVLVLDNSGTMSSAGRMTALKSAAKDFIDQAGGTAGGAIGSVNIGLVPYATTTRVPPSGSYNGVAYKDAPWILFTGGSFDDGGKKCSSEDGEDGEDGQFCTTFSSVKKSSWTGCMNDRLWNLDTNDVFYNGQDHAKYPARPACRSGETSLQTILPQALAGANLTSHMSSLKTHIDNMSSGGGANMTIGVSWGHAMLSRHDPFKGGTTAGARRVIILAAASPNTGAHVWSSLAVANQHTEMACASARSDDIEIYTISMSFNGTNDSLLRNCASGAANFFDASTSGELTSIFNTLARAIRAPRLTH